MELWAQKMKCWLCVEVTEELSKMAVVFIKEIVKMDIGVTLDRGMQITREWLDTCLPVYLLAMLITTRGATLQPWALYQFGLNMLWSCQYDETHFFKLFGVTPGQVSYVFALIGQPYDRTPQISDLQAP